jgi:hypothetical protein
MNVGWREWIGEGLPTEGEPAAAGAESAGRTRAG